MFILELLGISRSGSKARRRLSGVDSGVLIIAVGCVSLLGRNWRISAAIIAAGMLLAIVSAVKGRSGRGSGSA